MHPEGVSCVILLVMRYARYSIRNSSAVGAVSRLHGTFQAFHFASFGMPPTRFGAVQCGFNGAIKNLYMVAESNRRMPC